MTQEWMIKSLVDLGLERQDAKIYVYLALNGSKMTIQIADALKLYHKGVNNSTENLKDMGLIVASTNLPTVFSAVPFDRVLDQFIKTNVEEANSLEKEKDRILALWRSSIKETSTH